MTAFFRRAATALAVATLAAGCGGGGGDSGGDGNAPTGLVPVAPGAGATLVADAASLRPLGNGWQWTYAGSEVTVRGGAATPYTNTVTQSNVTATQATETASNPANGGVLTTTLQIANNEVSSTETGVDLTGTGLPGTVRTLELRSPVRANDQYVSLDRRYTNTAYDLDNDGRKDSIDVAVWSRVAPALETLTLADADATPVQAVRIDSTFILRFVLAANGLVVGTGTGNVSSWYVPGMGLVKQTAVTTDDVTGSYNSTTELLSAATALIPGVTQAPGAASAR